MRIALLGDFDTYLIRGQTRPRELLPYHLEPGLNLLRGLREVGATDVHILVVTPEVKAATVEDGPYGRVYRLPCPRGSGSASLFRWRRRILLEQLRAIQPDIVHGQGTEREYALTAVTSPYPHVVTLHGILQRVHQVVPPPVFSLAHIPRWVESHVLRRARHVICLSRGLEHYLRASGCPAQMHLIPNAVGPCFFATTPDTRADRVPALLFVGTIYPLKGLLHLVEALPAFEGRVVLRVIGATGGGTVARDYRQQIERRAQELGVSGQIEWLGVCPAEEVAATLARSDALVLPSFCENMPMCVAEAMAAGVPVVATTAPFIPDLIDHGVTGWLVTPGSTAELAEGLVKVVQDSGLAQRLATAARARAVAAFTPAAVAQQTLRVYEAARAPDPTRS